MAAEILDRLQVTFDVEMRQGYGVDEELEKRCQLARPTVALAPRDARTAPIVIAFSTFPGLLVRFGKRYTTAFPICGCDACAETLTDEAERLLPGLWRWSRCRASVSGLSESRFHSMPSPCRQNKRCPAASPLFIQSHNLRQACLTRLVFRACRGQVDNRAVSKSQYRSADCQSSKIREREL